MLGMDKLLEEGKRGYFLFAVALNAFVNYYFFVGEVIFCILYYVIRFLIFGEVRPMERLRGIFRCYIEGILGVMCAAILFLPSIVSILDNPKSGNTLPVKEFISRNLTAYLLLLRSPFLPGENMFALSAIQESDWTSNSLYLPVVGCCLVIAYILRRFRDRKQDWLSVLLVVCAIIAVFPFLNNMFVLFTREVMRRWFYMPILFMALATAKVLEEPDKYPWKKGIIISALMIILSQIYLLWHPEKVYFYKVYFLLLAAGFGGLLLTGICMRYYDRVMIRRGFMMAVCFGCIILTLFTVRNYRRYYRRAWDEKHPKSMEYIYNDLMYSTPGLGDSLPYRYFYWEFEMNRGMAAYEPTRNSFLSTPSPSVIEFYNRMGVGRPKNISPNGPDGLNELFSVRYYVRPDYWDDDILKEYSNGNMSLRVYENEEALPIGFTYDNYIALKDFRKIKKLNRGLAALKSLVVDDKDVKKVADILRPYDETLDGKPVAELRYPDMDKRRETSSENFQYGTDFFSCVMRAERPLYAYFSVPFDKCWHAFVNGKETDILKTNGMMAIRILPGYNRIRFNYVPVYRWAGAWLSLAGIVLSILYLQLARAISVNCRSDV